MTFNASVWRGKNRDIFIDLCNKITKYAEGEKNVSATMEKYEGIFVGWVLCFISYWRVIFLPFYFFQIWLMSVPNSPKKAHFLDCRLIWMFILV